MSESIEISAPARRRGRIIAVIAATAAAVTGVVAFRERADQSPPRPQLQRFLPTVWEASPPVVAFGSIWIEGLAGPGRWVVNRLDVASGRLEETIEAPRLAGLAATEEALWGWAGIDSDAPASGYVIRVDPDRAEVTNRTEIDVGGVLGTSDALWATDITNDLLVRFDAASGEPKVEIELDPLADVSSLVEGDDGMIWVNGWQDGIVQGIDPSTNRVAMKFRCHCEVVGAAGPGQLWLHFWSSGALVRYDVANQPSAGFVTAPETAPRLENVWNIAFSDNAFWWTDTVGENVHYADIEAVESGMRRGHAATLRLQVSRFTTESDSIVFVGWSEDVGRRLYRWSPRQPDGS